MDSEASLFEQFLPTFDQKKAERLNILAVKPLGAGNWGIWERFQEGKRNPPNGSGGSKQLSDKRTIDPGRGVTLHVSLKLRNNFSDIYSVSDVVLVRWPDARGGLELFWKSHDCQHIDLRIWRIAVLSIRYWKSKRISYLRVNIPWIGAASYFKIKVAPQFSICGNWLIHGRDSNWARPVSR